MKLGLAIHLGPLLASHRQRNLELAEQLRDRGVRHVFAMNLPETADPAEAKSQLEALAITTSVRPVPWIVEQVRIPATDTTPERFTANFTVNRESIARVNKLSLGEHGTYIAHEAHDTIDGPVRAWLCHQVRNPVIYYGHRGLWIKYGSDFGQHDVPHTVYVALNAAGATDASSGSGPGPAVCKAKDIENACRNLNERLAGKSGPLWPLMAHINVLESTPASRLVAMAYAAADCLTFDVLMFRVVFPEEHGKSGQTLTRPDGQHAITVNVLEAMGEMA